MSFNRCGQRDALRTLVKPMTLRECPPPRSPFRAPPSRSSQRPGVFNMSTTAVNALGEDVDPEEDELMLTTAAAFAKYRRKTKIGPWKLTGNLGEGSTAVVRLATNIQTGQLAAAKAMSTRSTSDEKQDRFEALNKSLTSEQVLENNGGLPVRLQREIAILRLVEHPLITKLHDVWANEHDLFLIIEYLEGGNLSDHITTNGPLKEADAVRILCQVLGGLEHCHRLNLYHRDIRLENILLDADGNAKIADFGLAMLQTSNDWLYTYGGTRNYSPPEVMRGEAYRGEWLDIWCCGIIFAAMLLGELPFADMKRSDALGRMQLGQHLLHADLSDEAIDLIQQFLHPDPAQRITMGAIWEHPLLKKHSSVCTSSRKLSKNAALEGKALHSEADIDQEVLQTLHILRHKLRLDELTKQLLDNRPNYEQTIYHALLRSQEQHTLRSPHPQYLDDEGYQRIMWPPRKGSLQDPRTKLKLGLDIGDWDKENAPSVQKSQSPKKYPFGERYLQAMQDPHPLREMRNEVATSEINLVNGPSRSVVWVDQEGDPVRAMSMRDAKILDSRLSLDNDNDSIYESAKSSLEQRRAMASYYGTPGIRFYRNRTDIAGTGITHGKKKRSREGKVLFSDTLVPQIILTQAKKIPWTGIREAFSNLPWTGSTTLSM